LVIVLSRSLNTYWSATELARMGFGPQAVMLNRSLFEDMIDAHWITVEPTLAVQRIDEHQLHGRMLLADAVRAEGLPEAELVTFDPAERSSLDGIFGEYGDRSWTGLGVHSRVMAVEHLWEPEEGGRPLLHFYRRFVQRESNQILHLSAFSMTGQVRERTATELTVALGPSADEYVGKALVASFYCFGQLISLVRDTFGFGDAEGWREIYDRPLGEIHTAVEDT